MSTDNRHSAPYSASDIEKYLKGQLSAREMHDLEQAALDDPFLADAIDGLSTQPPAAIHQDLADLRNRLDKKAKEDNRRIAVIRIRRRTTLAAAILLLLGIGYLFFIRSANQPQHPIPSIAAAKSATVKSADIAAKPPTAKSADTITNATAANTFKSQPQPAKSAHRTAVAANTSQSLTVAAEKAKGAADNIQHILTQSNPPSSELKTTLIPDTLSLPTALADRSLGAAVIKKDALSFPPSSPMVFTGKVLDLNNHPISGAFLALYDAHGFGTTTDDQGQFELSVPPRDSTRLLTVSMIGYDHASLAVNALSYNNMTSNIIRLRPSTSNLDEVVVVGYGTHRKEAKVAAPSESDEKLDTLWNIAAPVIGHQAYRQYLELAKKKLGLDSTITGTETVSFIVSRNGPLSSFKIEQSISPAHDAGILRLISDGPAWHLLRGKKARAAVSITF